MGSGPPGVPLLRIGGSKRGYERWLDDGGVSKARPCREGDQAAVHRWAIRISKARLTSEPRLQIHGHDYVHVLAWYIRQHKGFKAVTDDMVERALFASAESSQLMNETLFQSLLKRLRVHDH
jgi:hypothetical protein